MEEIDHKIDKFNLNLKIEARDEILALATRGAKGIAGQFRVGKQYKELFGYPENL